MAEHWGESQLMWAILERNVPNLTWWVVICRTEGTKTTDPLMPPKVNKVCWLFGSVDLMFIAYAIPMKQMVSLFFTIFWLSFSERHSYSFSALQNNFCVWSGTLPELSPCVPDTHIVQSGELVRSLWKLRHLGCENQLVWTEQWKAVQSKYFQDAKWLCKWLTLG